MIRQGRFQDQQLLSAASSGLGRVGEGGGRGGDGEHFVSNVVNLFKVSHRLFKGDDFRKNVKVPFFTDESFRVGPSNVLF